MLEMCVKTVAFIKILAKLNKKKKSDFFQRKRKNKHQCKPINPLFHSKSNYKWTYHLTTIDV